MYFTVLSGDVPGNVSTYLAVRRVENFFALSGALHHLPLSGRQVFAWLALRESCRKAAERVSHGIKRRKRCLIHKTKCGNSNTTLRGSGRILTSTALSEESKLLRLYQGARDAYPAVSLKCGGCSPALGHSTRLIPQKSVPDRIGFSDNNPLNLSSSVQSDNSDNAWYVNFDIGDVLENHMGDNYYVRCVR